MELEVVGLYPIPCILLEKVIEICCINAESGGQFILQATGC